jgi:hypothetical protein
MAARPGYGMAGAGGGLRLRQTFDTSDQVSLRPRQEFGKLIPLKSIQHVRVVTLVA